MDKKQTFTKQEHDTLSSLPVVKGIYSRYKINWGGCNMLKTVLFLLKKSVEDKENGYFHLLSGQDYPIKPVAEFTGFIDANQGNEFLEYHTLPHSRWENGTYRRYTFVPEETNFHTVVLNSPFKDHVVNRRLRYVDWRYRNGNYPANLNESD